MHIMVSSVAYHLGLGLVGWLPDPTLSSLKYACCLGLPPTGVTAAGVWPLAGVTPPRGVWKRSESVSDSYSRSIITPKPYALGLVKQEGERVGGSGPAGRK